MTAAMTQVRVKERENHHGFGPLMINTINRDPGTLFLRSGEVSSLTGHNIAKGATGVAAPTTDLYSASAVSGSCTVSPVVLSGAVQSPAVSLKAVAAEYSDAAIQRILALSAGPRERAPEGQKEFLDWLHSD